jgi:hypothetical protein
MPLTTTPGDGGAVALTDADIDRVDAVVRPATGLPFLIVKAAAGAEGADELLTDLTADSDGGGGQDDSQDGGADGGDDGPWQDPGGEADGGQDEAAAQTPGSQDWEIADAHAAARAAVVLAGLRDAVSAMADREAAEGEAGDDPSYSQAVALRDARGALDFALGVLATYHVTETADALRAGSDQVAKSAAAWARLFAPHMRGALSETRIRAIAADQVAKSLAERGRKGMTKTARAAASAPSDPAVGAGDYASVLKTALGEALEPVIEAQERAAGTLAGIEERVAAVEKARMPGGPLLRGAAGVSADGLWTVQRGGTPTPSVDPGQAPEALRKALSGIKDSRVRDAAGQAVAMGMHPLLAQPPAP